MPTDKRVTYYEQVLTRPDVDAPSCKVLINLALAYDAVQTVMNRALGRHGISVAAYNVLRILQRSGQEGCPLHEIGELLVTSRANVTGLVDSLEAKGLVRRVPDPSDRRSRRAFLTDEGEKLLQVAHPEHAATMCDLVSGLSDVDKQHLAELLVKLRTLVGSSF
ncbi:MAG TPA: MarR family transcriptional regulator [Candidatus Xenobia bacterium]|jgi:MarR family 2-MHQ and catechol resistance regulon transcriptional repressor